MYYSCRSRLPASRKVVTRALGGSWIAPGIVVLVSIRLLEVIPVSLLIRVPAVAIVILVAVVARTGKTTPALATTDRKSVV